MAEKILVTGGAGYIGSHCVLELAEAGYVPVVIDNFHNAIRGADALPESLQRVQQIVHQPILFQELDITNEAALQELFSKHRFSAVMHFAGLKAVGESVQKPLEYYRVNLTGTIQLLETMKAHGVRNIVFSSSATVYGDPKYLPLDENHPVGGCTNPYGKSKFFIEEMIRDLCKAERDWNAVLLRYFNPIGAHESGMIGEDPQGIPNNLMPYVAQVAVGRREFLSVFGNDYKTDDGTGVRDYIHVVDLAKGHIAALKKLKENCGCKIYNLGTGTGYSVLQMVQAMEKASGREVRSSTRSRAGGREMWPPATPTQRWPSVSWAGKLPLAWTRCVRTCGGGSCRIPQASARTELWPKGSPGCCGLLWASSACLPSETVIILGAVPAPPPASCVGQEGRSIPSLSTSHPHSPRSFASHRAETQGRTELGPSFGTQGTKPPCGNAQGLVPAPGRKCLAGPCSCSQSCSWAFPVPWVVATSSTQTSESCQAQFADETMKPFHAAPSPQPAQLREQGWFPVLAGESRGTHCPLPWAGRGLLSTYLMASGHRNAQTPALLQGPVILRPPWLISPAQLPRAKALMGAKGFPPQHGFGDQVSSPTYSCRARVAPARGCASPGHGQPRQAACSPSPPLPLDLAGAWFCFHVACGSRFHNHIAKGFLGESSAQLSNTGPIYCWQF